MTHIFLLPLGRRVTFTKLYGVCNQHSVIEMNACYPPAVVEDALLCPTLGGLLLFLLFDLGGLRLDLAGTSERAVNWKRRAKGWINTGAGTVSATAGGHLFPWCLDDGGDGARRTSDCRGRRAYVSRLYRRAWEITTSAPVP
jgi:hypothetical protein